MSRKPIHQVGPMDTRDTIWVRIREWKKFTVRGLADETRLSRDTVYDYVNGLEKAGYLRRIGTLEAARPGLRKATVFELVKDVGIDAPRVRKDGTEVTQGRGREQLWTTIAILKKFTPRDLALHASTEEHPVAESEAKTYCVYLAKAGYLARVKPGLYQHLPSKRSGPKPPQIQRVKQVFDPNLGVVVWQSGGGA